MKRLVVGGEIRTRILVGAVAFVTLIILEVALAIGLFDRSIGEYLAELRSPAGVIGLAAQFCFATFPLLNLVVRRRSNLSVVRHSSRPQSAQTPPCNKRS